MTGARTKIASAGHRKVRPGAWGHVRGPRAPSRWRTLGAGLWIFVAACAAPLSLQPDPMAPGPAASASSAASGGVTVEVIPEEWRYSPIEIPTQVIPLRVRITNVRAEPVLVSLTDVVVLDDRGTRRAAMDPGDAVQLAAKAGEEGSMGPGPGGIRPGITITQGIGIGGIGIGIGSGSAGGPVWGPGAGGFPVDPGGVDSAPLDALRMSLRPGRLDPNTRVEGYLFFERPLEQSDRDRGFRLSWDFRALTPVGVPSGPSLATVVVLLRAR
ncbi:MAG: hypothetical protein A2Y95_01685 [Deltaproteobacteria bacterium RBG_13_65_10]|nr:MAG: hypothetical protein A2Y95_01685 [Deltaproteobacteria bacterium RBG_13_65_10]